jgi:predicted dehydrogenase
MKQVLQNLRTGEIDLAEVPCPAARPGQLLIQSRATLISAGTERMLVEFGKGSLLAKAKAQPDKVRQVLDKIRAEGLLPTIETVFARLDEPLPLGYCNAGVVLEVGEGVKGFKPGDRVVSNGPHAELVCVPQNLCARIPEGVTDEQAAFTVLTSIGLQGLRLVAPTLGETIAVTGLGLIGYVTVQLLLANGCRVVGIDPNPRRLELARQLGADVVDVPNGADPVETATAMTNGRGVDGVIVAAASKSHEIMHQAAQMCRKRGRIVLVGVVGLELSRSDFYKKELTFQVSCSYGPGRYDPQYEDRGQDYPLGFVRWTEQRNFEAILDLLVAKRLDVAPAISDRIEVARAAEAYRTLTDDRDAMGIVLTYPTEAPARDRTIAAPKSDKTVGKSDQCTVGVIGAGNFAKMYGLPSLSKTNARLACIADISSVAAAYAARKFGFERSSTDAHDVMDNPDINTVVILVRHDLHAPMILEALGKGKHVFVEKPLCLKPEQIEEIGEALRRAEERQLMVGFNRRFAPHTLRMKSLLAGRTEPLCMSMTVNAGVSPPDSWVHDPKVGGGRILGEGCHWIDLMMDLAGARIQRVAAMKVGEAPGLAVRDDKTSITLTFADGSIGTLHYFGNGHKGYPKEQLAIFCNGRTLHLDNFRLLTGYGWPGFSKMRLWRWDKGHAEEFNRFVTSIHRGESPVIAFSEIENVTRATFAAVEAAETGRVVELR